MRDQCTGGFLLNHSGDLFLMKVELISTGDEVMEGFIDDTNSSWISRRLIDRGIEVSRRSSTGDDREAISAVIKECSGRADVVIVNGGLGPTTDDLTTEAARCRRSSGSQEQCLGEPDQGLVCRKEQDHDRQQPEAG